MVQVPCSEVEPQRTGRTQLVDAGGVAMKEKSSSLGTALNLKSATRAFIAAP
jgi:hypothetical protein